MHRNALGLTDGVVGVQVLPNGLRASRALIDQWCIGGEANKIHHTEADVRRMYAQRPVEVGQYSRTRVRGTPVTDGGAGPCAPSA